MRLFGVLKYHIDLKLKPDSLFVCVVVLLICLCLLVIRVYRRNSNDDGRVDGGGVAPHCIF